MTLKRLAEIIHSPLPFGTERETFLCICQLPVTNPGAGNIAECACGRRWTPVSRDGGR